MYGEKVELWVSSGEFFFVPFAAVLCELRGYELFLFIVNAFQGKSFNREDRRGNAKIAKKGRLSRRRMVRPLLLRIIALVLSASAREFPR
jgi:hypothetical protein